MSWIVSHRIEWTDILALDWKIEILQQDFGGSVSFMQATDVPLKISYLANSDNIYEFPIHGSMAEFSVYSDTNFQWIDIFSSFDLQKKVNIYYNDVLFWSGFITPGQYSEPYDGTAYQVTISASDSLGFLKNIPFDNNGIAYSGRQFESQIIFDILAKIQITEFTEFVNLFEVEMYKADINGPFDQIKIDEDVFLDMNCYEVLEHILRKYNAIIRQKYGAYCIYRPTELINLSISGRFFTEAQTHTLGSINPAQSISRSTSINDIRDVEGGTLQIQQIASKVTIKQDYGNKESWIENYNFIAKNFTKVSSLVYTAKNWSKANSCSIIPINNSMPAESDGVLITSHNVYPTLSTYIYQSFGVHSLATDNILTFQFDYLLYNFSTADITGEVFYVQIKADHSNKYLYVIDDNYCGWDDSFNQIEITADALIASNDWVTFTRNISGLHTSDSYTIKLFALDDDHLQVYLGLKNIRFFSTSDAIVLHKNTTIGNKFGYQSFQWGAPIAYGALQNNPDIVERIYTSTNANYGIAIDIDCPLGDVTDTDIDNVLEQFKGSLARSVSGDIITFTNLWATRGNAENQPLLQLISDELAYQYSRSKQQIHLPIMENDTIDNFPHIDLLGCYEDPLNVVNGTTRKFVINQASFNCRDREWELDLVELIPPAAAYVVPYAGLGALYNWFAVNTGKLAPSGWHIPSYTEFWDLVLAINPTATNGITNIAGGPLKAAELLDWDLPNTGATNIYGFNGLAAGDRLSSGGFNNIDLHLFLWNAEAYDSTLGRFSSLSYTNAALETSGGGSNNAISKNFGASVRCIKDSTSLSIGQIGIMTDIDGTVYPTICLPDGNEWMASNLKVEHFNDNTPIPNITNDSLWAADTAGAMCYYDNTTEGLNLSVYAMTWQNPDPLTYLSSVPSYSGGGVFSIYHPSWIDIAVYNGGSPVSEGSGWYTGYEIRVTPNVGYTVNKTGVININANSLTRNINLHLIIET